MTKEERLEYNRIWRKNNKEKVLKYKSNYRKKNKEKIKEYKDKYYQEHKKEIKEYKKTKAGRACNLVGRYKSADKQANRGKCTLTAQWVINNIFSSKCHYCGETDWTKLGADRIDNDKPHTPDNCVPCCYECNTKRGTKDYEEFLKQIK